MRQQSAQHLFLELGGKSTRLEPDRSYSVGRDPRSDFAVHDTRVSWRHATISCIGTTWVLQDLGSTNGTYVAGRRATQVPVADGTVVHLGNADNGPRLAFTGAPNAASAAGQGVPQRTGRQVAASSGPRRAQTPGPRPPADQAVSEPVHVSREATTIRHLPASLHILRIGRGRDNDLVLSDLSVSRHHAQLRRLEGGRYEIVDLDSHNGTYLNGQPIARHVLGTHDVVGIGHSTFRLVGDRLEEFVDTGEVCFSARRLTVQVEHKGVKKLLLNDVSFTVPEKSLIAVIGPSGSGKSTLLRALTGYRPADRGEVLYDGRNLYRQFAELRQRIGLVPQDDILHAQLTVRTALKYAAELRFPRDTEAAERERRIEEVLVELHLDKRADNKITALSGGQRKRVSVALELLTKPSLIFLDEPTSGLDPGMDRDMMKVLRDLADEGRTVLVVTHSVAELALCDRLLVMAPGGCVAYFGPPQQALAFFHCDTWADVFEAFEVHAAHDWAGRFRSSALYRKYVADADAMHAPSAHTQPRQAQPPAQHSCRSQLSPLIRRYLAVIAADRGYVGLLIALPLIMGVMSMAIPAKYGLGPVTPPAAEGQSPFNTDAATVLLVLAVGACLTGAANAVRELIKERVIYERERAVGLSRSAYLMSKVIVLGAITALQAVVLSVIGLLPRKLPTSGLLIPSTPLPEMVLVVMLLGITSMMLGLVVSAAVKTAEKTMPLLVLIAIVQVVFCGSLFPLFASPGLQQLAWLSPSRWAVAAEAATINLPKIMGPPQGKSTTDPLWQHTQLQWLTDVGALAGLATLCAILVMRLLRLHEPEIMRSR